MRILICIVAVLSCIEANAAGCPNGQCGVRKVNGTVQTVRNVTKGAVQVVTPPYRGRCSNGKCKVR